MQCLSLQSHGMKIGIIGCGKMAHALAVGAYQSGALNHATIMVYDPVPQAMETLASEINAISGKDLTDLITECDTLLLCVKPDTVGQILTTVAESQRTPDELLIISIAAGIQLDFMERTAGHSARFVRVMPNTPALVGEGAAAYSLGNHTSLADGEIVEGLLSAVGSVLHVKEQLMNAVTGLSGSGPAYIYMIIEALADGGVLEGLPRKQALELAVQTVIGAATMVRETGLHPAELRDRVTSPGGTTIAGITALEEGGLRSTLIKAVHQATQRGNELGAE